MGDFSLSRSTRVRADAATVHALIDDFREWTKWSPWENVDPDLRRDYTGPVSGVGSTYKWSGNRKAGEGMMRITGSTPTSVVVDLEFLKPFKATNVTRSSSTSRRWHRRPARGRRWSEPRRAGAGSLKAEAERA